MRFLAILFLTGILAGCGSTYSDSDKRTFDKQISAFIKKKNWKMEKRSSGLYMEILQKGTGTEKAKFTSQVKLVYKGTLLNGKIFDNTDPNKPFESPVNGLIAGFQEALLDQTAGAKLRLIVPPHLGYGDDELEKIPSNSVLVFELELADVF